MTTAADLAARYDAGAVPPDDVAEAVLASDPVAGPVGAFVASDPDDVRRQAAAATARRSAGQVLGPLDGVPVGVKDFFAVDGYVSRGGTRDLVAHGEEDSVVAARLRAAGAIIVGKTHTTELGLSPTGMNMARGTPRNPHSLDHLPGGSSSGTGAAVGAGQILAGVGSDGGGSVRIPSAMNGVFGIKPSWDVVPKDGGMPIGWWSLDHIGPLARGAEDLATMLTVMAARTFPAPDRPLRFGVDWAWWGQPDPSVDAACRAAIAELDPVSLTVPHVELAQIVGFVTALSECAAGVWDLLHHQPERLSDDVRAQLAQHPNVSGVDYVRAQQARQLLADAFDQVFAGVDVLVLPTCAITAPPRPQDDELAAGVVDVDWVEGLTAYAFPANLCGLPAASVPVGTARVGGADLPVGLQLVAARDRDDLVLAACRQVEQAGLAARPIPRAVEDPITSLLQRRT